MISISFNTKVIWKYRFVIWQRRTPTTWLTLLGTSASKLIWTVHNYWFSFGVDGGTRKTWPIAVGFVGEREKQSWCGRVGRERRLNAEARSCVLRPARPKDRGPRLVSFGKGVFLWGCARENSATFSKIQNKLIQPSAPCLPYENKKNHNRQKNVVTILETHVVII